MKKCIFLLISCFVIVFMSLTTGICQPVINNGTFDGTVGTATATNTAWNNTCGYASVCTGCDASPELNNSIPCYSLGSHDQDCVNYGSCGTSCNIAGSPYTPDYVAEVDGGNSKQLCQTLSNFSANTSYTLNLNIARRETGSAPATTTIQVCFTNPTDTTIKYCTYLSDASTSETFSPNSWTFNTNSFPAGLLSSGKAQMKITCANCTSNYGMNISSISIGVATPVTLINFKAVKNGSAVDLDWQTATEINNDYFTVEKSKNGVDFTILSIVDGAGNSQSTLNYQTTDHSPYNGISYYRLKQVDYDGKYSYSKIVAVENEEMEITIYPNPSLGSFKVNVTNEKQPYSIEVTDAEGRLVFNKSVESSDTSLTEIDGLTKGVYIVHIAGTNTVVNKKLVVL